MIRQPPEEILDRVLVLAPFGRDSELITHVLNRAEIKAERVSTVDDLCEKIKVGVGCVLIAYEALNQESIHLLQQAFHEQEPWSDFPVFVMTYQGDSRAGLLPRFLEPLSGVTILERPLRGETLVSAFRAGLRARARQYQMRALLESERLGADALRDSEKRYRRLAEALPLLVWTCLPTGECDYLSRQWLEYTGVPEKDQLGFGWLDRIHPDDRDRTDQAWTIAYNNGSLYDLEFRLRRSDGVYRWFKTRGVPVKDSDGDIEKWFGSCTDIEDQKQVSEERRELLQSEKKARELAELLNRVGPMLLQELDSQRLAQQVIDLATQMTGAECGALFHRVNNDDCAVLYAISGTWPLNTEEVPRPEFGDHSSILSADILVDPRFQNPSQGVWAPVRSYLASPIVSRAGRLLGALLFVNTAPDVFGELHVQLAEGIAAQAAIAFDNARLFAETQQSHETLTRSNMELRRANEDLNQFAYSASHDLQEPLRMVALYSQMMQRKYRSLLDTPGQDYLRYMVQGARRMELLLKDLLDYTQVVSAADEPIETCDANQIFKDTLENLGQVISDTGAQVTCEPLPALAVKGVHLLQIFQNLIGNALKYRTANQPLIHISAQPDAAAWRLSVKDNGLGIAAQYSQQVFGLFKRLHGNSQYEGTGIGLAICQKIVERYGGRIWVESAGEGEGSTFLFTLPGVPYEESTVKQ